MSLTVRSLDLFDDADITAFHRVRWAALGHGRPHVVPSRLAEFTRSWRSGPEQDGWRRQAVGVFEGGELRAVAYVQESLDDDGLDTSWVGVHTDPAHQRRGFGARAFAAVEPLVDASRARMLATTHVPTPEVAGHGYRRFAERLGFVVGTSATAVALDLPVAVPDEPTPTGYRIESHVDGVPEHFRVGLGVLKGLVDAEAPSGDIPWEAAPVTPERYAHEIAALTATGGHAVESLAVDERSGEVVAFTEIAAYDDPDRPCNQEGTLVRSDHRGRGLGRAVKLANLRALQQTLPRHRRILSESDDANTWMHAVNAGLGFRPVETILYCRKEIR